MEKIRVKCMFSITVPSSSCPWRFGSEYPWFMTHLSPQLTARLYLGNKGITGFLYPRRSCPPPRPLSGFATSCTAGLFLVVLPPCHLVATGALLLRVQCSENCRAQASETLSFSHPVSSPHKGAPFLLGPYCLHLSFPCIPISWPVCRRITSFYFGLSPNLGKLVLMLAIVNFPTH